MFLYIVFTFLKTFKIWFRWLQTNLCVPLFLTYTTITITSITCSIFLSAYNLFVSNNTCSLNLYSAVLKTTTVLFTFDASLHKTDWITTACCLSCPFIVLHKQSNQHIWSCIFVLSLSREFYCNFIFICVLCTYCLLLHSLTLRFRYLSLSYFY